MNAVSDAGPLITLAKLRALHLVTTLYHPVFVPSVAYGEVVAGGAAQGYPDAEIVQRAVLRAELHIIEMTDADLPPDVRGLPLGIGERHALGLALRERADWILLDDRPAREKARALGLHVAGTVGILAAAYRAGLLSVEERDRAFEMILNRPDIWISASLVRRVWAELAGESL